ncbi:SPRY domain-containing SOCS box protein 3-like [Lytechinus variegatus]|uniref:SPRY domain-containing SOCS box protein 3-like n=1 Tax=Lytechinus variegatus TaxID=7654 RepID=UPI001BB1822F|nr:SPRY domain-containing SOCS box protein 3-like [Lytechinus variegatus]
MEEFNKNKRNRTEPSADETKEAENKVETPSTSASTSANSSLTPQQQTSPKAKQTNDEVMQPPKKRRKGSVSPSSSPSNSTSPSSGSSSRRSRDNSPAIDLIVNSLIRQRHPDGVVGGSPTQTESHGSSTGQASDVISYIPPPPPYPSWQSPQRVGTPPQSLGLAPTRRQQAGVESGVGILRDGAGWPGFGSEEEMGMSSSGAEEDERNNKYSGFEWQWDDNAKSNACCLAKMKTEVRFHLDYSCGTAAARGSENMKDGQFFWEVKMVSPVYGTDMMIGVGTQQVDLNQYSRAFCSMLGHEPSSESCGLSYTGRFQKGGIGRMYCSKFGQGAIIGMHLDMWFGTLTYYRNGKHLGVATRNLLGKTWYPIVSSTAARSSMRLVNTKSFPSNLQFWCCQALRKAVPPEHNVLDVVPLPPGLKNFLDDNLSWLLRAHVECKTKETQTVLSMMSKRWKEKMDPEDEDV